MLEDVRQVWVIQQRSTGLFLSVDLFPVQSLRAAGRCFDRDSAEATGDWNFPGDFELHAFYEPDGGD